MFRQTVKDVRTQPAHCTFPQHRPESVLGSFQLTGCRSFGESTVPQQIDVDHAKLRLIHGCFYCLDFADQSGEFETFPDSSVFLPDNVVSWKPDFEIPPEFKECHWADIVAREKAPRLDCDTCSKARSTASEDSNLRTLTSDVYFHDRLNPFTPTSDGAPLCRNDVVAELRSKDVSGVRFVKATCTNQGEPASDIDLHWANCSSRCRLVPPVVPPRVRNECPNCGSGQLVCPECGQWMNICVTCKTLVIATSESTARGTGRRTPTFEIPVESTWIVDASKWPRFEFMNVGPFYVVTRRVVDILKAARFGPLRAYSLPTNVYGMTENEIAELKESCQRGVN